MQNLASAVEFPVLELNDAWIKQRLQNLAAWGSKKVLLLCAGSKLPAFTRLGKECQLEIWGNDLNQEEKRKFPQGKWIIGDCFSFSPFYFDTVVFSPVVTGRIDRANPSYYDFLKQIKNYQGKAVLTLPDNTFTSVDQKRLFHKLCKLITCAGWDISLDCLKENQRVKFVDLYLSREK